MDNPLTLGRKALIERLTTISVANGYFTSAGGNVRTGWLNEQLQARDASFPIIVVQKGRGQAPVPGPMALKAFSGFSIVGAVSTGMDDYEDAIEALEYDLLKCLVPVQGRALDWLPKGVTGITVGTPETFPPGESLKAATVLIPVQLHTIIQGEHPHVRQSR
jgi:hypothetical protein